MQTIAESESNFAHKIANSSEGGAWASAKIQKNNDIHGHTTPLNTSHIQPGMLSWHGGCTKWANMSNICK